ncbi:MAG: CocE/NonD family hydrolase, partial [Gammaproteobacteria bacterium]|nr:CocE/NonD family hydrolase [Gammaproteobacteria bacterium]
WKHGSVCEDFAAIACPVLAIGGWADAYTNAVPRLLAGLKVPRLGIIGPWGHVYPHDGVPGPAIGYLQEAVRWWDQWLKGKDTGIMREPMLRAYVEDAVAPEGTRSFVPGSWVGERTWPSDNIRKQRFFPGADGSLAHERRRGADAVLTIRSPQSHGKAGGEWMGTGCPGEQATDQRLDDGGALLFDTPVLDKGLSVLGAPALKLRIAADAPVAQLAVRLSDVHPDGSVTRVTYQVLNLTHRDSHETPEALEPGRYYDVSVELNACGHHFPPGHRVRLAIASAYWPLVWPAPYAATLSVRTGESALELPVRGEDPGPSVSFAPPVHGPRTPMTTLAPGTVRRFTMQDHVTGESTYVTEGIGGVFGEGVLRFDEVDVELAHSLKRELQVKDDAPLSARYVLTQSYEMGRKGWRTRIDTRAEMHSDRDTFYIRATLTAKLEGELVAEREWDVAVPRDLV